MSIANLPLKCSAFNTVDLLQPSPHVHLHIDRFSFKVSGGTSNVEDQ
jgi:hypothetical protein